MTLVTGTIAEIYAESGESIAKVRLGGLLVKVPLTFVPDAKVGDVVLVDGGVAVGRMQNELDKEA